RRLAPGVPLMVRLRRVHREAEEIRPGTPPRARRRNVPKERLEQGRSSSASRMVWRSPRAPPRALLAEVPGWTQGKQRADGDAAERPKAATATALGARGSTATASQRASARCGL